MHDYQGERHLQDENRTLAIPGGFQVNKEIPMYSGQLPQVRNSLITTLEYILSLTSNYIPSNIFARARLV